MTRTPHSPARPSALLQFAAVGYVGIVLIASLYPFAGGRVPDPAWLWTQFSEWPRYYTYTDMVMNVGAYVPVGMLVARWLAYRFAMVQAAGYAVMTGIALCVCVEFVQAGMPTRVPSGLDVFCNSTGTLIGAWLALLMGVRRAEGGALDVWRRAHVGPGISGDAMLLLLVLWVAVQFKPDHWLFAVGDVSHRSLSPGIAAAHAQYGSFETAIAMAGTIALAATVGTVARRRRWTWILLLVLAGLVVRSLASLLFFRGGTLVLWMTPGNLTGLAIGLVAAFGVSRLPASLARPIAILAIVATAVLVNAVPVAQTAQPVPVELWRQSHLRSVAGAAQALAVLWPLLAVLAAIPRRPGPG